MRNLARNKQTIYYALYSGKTDIVDENGNKTGDKSVTYSTPVAIKVNVSASRGTADLEMFGINTNYSRTVVTDDTSCPIKEDSILWVDKATTEPHDYVVVKVAKSFNHITYAIQEVSVGA